MACIVLRHAQRLTDARVWNDYAMQHVAEYARLDSDKQRHGEAYLGHPIWDGKGFRC